MDRGRPTLVVDDIHKSFGGLEVLKGVSLAAEQGDVIALIGASGSGKSTFLRCINLLETPDSGSITVAGETIRMGKDRDGRAIAADRRQVDRIRTHLGMVFQSFNLWTHMTILENVIEAPVHVLKRPKAEAAARPLALLEKVGIADKAGHYPAHLSGGQQQRAAIARACGMSGAFLYRRIVLPKAACLALPGYSNEVGVPSSSHLARLHHHAHGPDGGRARAHRADLPRLRDLHLRGRALPGPHLRGAVAVPARGMAAFRPFAAAARRATLRAAIGLHGGKAGPPDGLSRA
ncbi:MAG: ATP-binding cassette domain-containing protein [Alphaproteobacteria bacterium]|nr:ATP-binding cassette domain-containing protein [Alphaproteobacteria bacterium]